MTVMFLPRRFGTSGTPRRSIARRRLDVGPGQAGTGPRLRSARLIGMSRRRW